MMSCKVVVDMMLDDVIKMMTKKTENDDNDDSDDENRR